MESSCSIEQSSRVVDSSSSSSSVGLDLNNNAEQTPESKRLIVAPGSKEPEDSSRAEDTSPIITGRRRAVLHVLCATSAAFQIGYVIGYSSAVTSDFRSASEPLRMRQRALSWFGSIITAWALCGSLLAVPLMKKLGKYPTIMTCDAVFLLGWILVATAHGHVQLFCGRSLTGLSMGMAFAVIPLYIGELSPPHIRGVLGTLFNVVVAAGIPAVYVLGVYLDWRDMAKFACAFATFSVVACGTLPESPYWLAAQGKVERAVRVFRLIADARDDDDDDGNKDKEIRERVEQIFETRDQAKGFDMESFRQSHVIRPFFLVLLFCAIQQLSGINAVIYNVHYIFRAAHFYDEDLASIMVGLVQLIVMMGAAPFMDRAGRRIMLIVSGLGTSACLLLLGIALYHVGGDGAEKQDSFYPPEGSNATVGNTSTIATSSQQEEEEVVAASGWAWVALVSSLFYIGFFAVGLGPIPFVLIGEMVPRQFNELAGGVASIVNNLTSLVVIQSFISLSSMLAIHAVVWFYCGCCLLSAALTWRLLPEIRGKTLMEIQDLFRRGEDRQQDAGCHAEPLSPDETSDLV